jgi:hypothetical protein
LAIVALFAVNADDAAAFRTLVLLRLLYDERVDSVVLYERKILQHAHVVFCAIALIELFQSSAGLFAFKAKFYFTFLNVFAVFDFTSNNANCFIGICRPAAVTFIFLSQISHANPAVHPAWCDQLCVERSLHFPLVNSYRFNDNCSLALYPAPVLASHIWGGLRQSNRI